ncbi:TRAP transporter substrate-binding protein [Labrenzia sp. CE80]|uniref:TRAP transporter substrate-binding protein n=1 Tax=Labrenzia sp. CE80 TaxID=1788986 RepID=UPI00129C06D5|nr:TRAP transporter substrate-binding protein [Labrenzia sp. CE80]
MSPIKITFGGYQGDNSVHTRGARKLCELLSSALGDRVDVEFRQNIVSQGHKASDLLSLTESGELDGCYFSSSYLAGRVPELALFDQHFAVADRRHAYGVLDGSLGRRLSDEVAAKTGFVVLGYWDNGLRHISSAQTEIRRPEDCDGLKLRTLASDDHQRVFKALGFDPMAIDVRDLPEAVANFRVDAQENPLTNIYNFDLHKTHRKITLTGHLLGVALVLFNRKTVESWPTEVREAVMSAVSEATRYQRQLAEEDDGICTKALVADGVKLIELTAPERAEFAKATRAEVEKTRQRFSSELIDLFENDLAQVN